MLSGEPGRNQEAPAVCLPTQEAVQEAPRRLALSVEALAESLCVRQQRGTNILG